MIRSAVNFPFLRNEKLEVVYGDMRDIKSLKAAMKDVGAVVHLAASKSDEENSDDINVEGVKRLVLACREEGCRRIINISTQSVKIRRKGIYARTKREAEKALHCSGLQVTSLRPSIVYGEEQLGVFGTVLNFVQKLPFVPILGDGKWISAPVYIGDVSEAVISCIRNDSTIGKIYDLGGPDQISFDSFINLICAEMDIRRPKVHIPLSLSMVVAKVLTKIMSRPPITVSNILGSNQDTEIDIAPAQKDFGFNPISFKEGLKVVLNAIPKPNSPESTEYLNDDRLNDDRELKEEAVLITKYLLDYSPTEELCKRYIEANRVLLDNYNSKSNSHELGFIRLHPWALPFIDAAAGLLSPGSIVRKKVLLMAAILETSPVYADYFLHRADNHLSLLVNIVWNGLRIVFKLSVGIPIYILARRA